MERVFAEEKKQIGARAAETARLAMLKPEDAAAVERDFDAMIGFAGELAYIDIQPSNVQMPQQPCPLRPDIPQTGLSADEALMNASTTRGRLITVPRAFE